LFAPSLGLIASRPAKAVLTRSLRVSHLSSYGYRPGRSGHHAIGKAELFIRRYRRDWVVDMDLSKCFDRLNHDVIIRQFRRRITDGSVLSLLR